MRDVLKALVPYDVEREVIVSWHASIMPAVRSLEAALELCSYLVLRFALQRYLLK
jgi:hypothetical protein